MMWIIFLFNNTLLDVIYVKWYTVLHKLSQINLQTIWIPTQYFCYYFFYMAPDTISIIIMFLYLRPIIFVNDYNDWKVTELVALTLEWGKTAPNKELSLWDVYTFTLSPVSYVTISAYYQSSYISFSLLCTLLYTVHNVLIRKHRSLS